jgi:hypothetical protein
VIIKFRRTLFIYSISFTVFIYKLQKNVYHIDKWWASSGRVERGSALLCCGTLLKPQANSCFYVASWWMKKSNILSRHVNMIRFRVRGQKVTLGLDGTEGNSFIIRNFQILIQSKLSRNLILCIFFTHQNCWAA